MYDSSYEGVIATMHVAMIGESTAEFGFTVHKDFRNRGFGSILFERAVTWAKAHNIDKVFMHCLSENKAVRSIAKKNEMHVITIQGGEAEADLVLPKDLVAPMTDVMLDRMAVYDMLLINQQKFLKNIFRIKQ
jgi:GNAT superfamily N-acetyltransferase